MLMSGPIMSALRLMGQAETVRDHPSPHKCRLVSCPYTVRCDGLMAGRTLCSISRLLFTLKLYTFLPPFGRPEAHAPLGHHNTSGSYP